MSRKSTIVFVIAAVAVTSALVFDGVSRRRANTGSNGQPATQSQQMAAAADDPASSNAYTPADGQADMAAAVASTQPEGFGQDSSQQDVGASDDSEGQSVADVDTSAAQSNADATPAPDPIVVPAGTRLTVRLGEDLGSRISRVNQRFSATLDRDIVVRGETVIAAGTAVTGKVVSAKPAGPLTGEANLQLKITSVRLDNGSLSVATATRSFGPTIKGKNKVGKFMKGIVKRASGQEREVLLAEQSACTFTLQKRLEIN